MPAVQFDLTNFNSVIQAKMNQLHSTTSANDMILILKALESAYSTILNGTAIILELKATKKLDLPQFWREAEVEAENYAKARGLKEVPYKFVIVKRRQAGIDKAWVVEDLEQWTKRAGK